MRILLWHGYLLGGTGSNVYSRALAREWSRDGHDVVVVSQERAPEQYDLGGARTVAVDLPGGLLPVFVMDHYEGLNPKFLQDFTEAERRAYVDANAAALRELLPADLVFANHVLMGGPVGAASGARFRVKAHGSELEYSMRGRPELGAVGESHPVPRGSHVCRLAAHSRGARRRRRRGRPRHRGAALVSTSTSSCCGTETWRSQTYWPRRATIHRTAGDERLPDDGNAARLAAFLAEPGPLVVYFGKLIEQKGVQVLLEAMKHVDARLSSSASARIAPSSRQQRRRATLFTGPLEHRHLVHLLPLADATVVPSIFPEAFGMVAAEAAAAGSPPLVARHSGLAEVAAGLEEEYPERFRHLASFETGDAADLARKLQELLALSPAEHEALSAGGAAGGRRRAGRGGASRGACSRPSSRLARIPSARNGRRATRLLARADRAEPRRLRGRHRLHPRRRRGVRAARLRSRWRSRIASRRSMQRRSRPISPRMSSAS